MSAIIARLDRVEAAHRAQFQTRHMVMRFDYHAGDEAGLAAHNAAVLAKEAEGHEVLSIIVQYGRAESGLNH